jgi:hypothetical protein
VFTDACEIHSPLQNDKRVARHHALTVTQLSHFKRD